LEQLPAELFGHLLNQVLERLAARPCSSGPFNSLWQSVESHFSAAYIADGSTLEALQKQLPKDPAEKKTNLSILGGKMMMLVHAATHVPVKAWYTSASGTNDKHWCDEIAKMLPTRGLIIFDLGFFSFEFFDKFTSEDKFFVTRLREKTSFDIQQELGRSEHWTDQIITLGRYRSNPCKSPVRLVGVQWGTQWYYYLTNVLDPNVLSARQVCDLYRQRWRIEDAFLLTKRLLGLSYLWVGGKNGIETQIYATWILYAVLIHLSHQVAKLLAVPQDRISIEMVFRGLYHVSRAQQRGVADDAIKYLVENAKLLAIVKSVRKRDRLRDQQTKVIWGHP